MKLYVIRHGQTEQGKNRIIANLDEPLNNTGTNQEIYLQIRYIAHLYKELRILQNCLNQIKIYLL